ncbi:MAG: AmmeMemoRadiSam system protein B [Nitrospirota bacterium]
MSKYVIVSRHYFSDAFSSPKTLMSLLFLCMLVLTPFSSGCTEQVKEPAVAGTFYPADSKELKDSVDAFISGAKKGQWDGRLIALISPHAGYRYSGQVAAYGYREISGSAIKNVILIGASHHTGFKGASVFAKGKFRTPLGDVNIHEKLASRLLNESADVRFYPEAFAREHSLEVQLPFLQTVLEDFAIVPILIGSPTKQTFDHLVSKLTAMVDEKTLIIASTDLSHYHSYQKALAMDNRIISALERLSSMHAGQLLQNGEAELCGSFPVIISLEVAKRLGATYGALFNYANSGDVTGEKGKVVGYASLGLFKSPYTEEEKKELLGLAKTAVTEHVTSGKTPEPETVNRKFKTDGAVFVTIKKKGSLRGCIGHVQAVMPLYQSVIKNAVAASSGDPRFPPMTRDELPDVDIEVSVLSPLNPLKDIDDIQIGRHGLVIRKSSQSGLLLPQVASEQGWDRGTFLEQICAKAGLPKDAWKAAELFTFTAETIK